ncbi:hypothetical protein DEA8626_00553 [Defluviimonas aquaemixtae]|uniref:Cytochrome c domain-containing protein n=1 Tax=Albidovulum aquaemixtae TaxID=1542388 RepID=A0A2R8B303_9RHOB|nr:cytochrome c [Defluviimonas aquaemixtae]SPH17039.1 hypothetical protein DEA8626_00553 [Defluviimonas aquaemixtae]
MLKSIFHSTIALALCVTGAAAQDAAIGQEIFQDRCVVCHGETGAGDGIVAELFDQKPRNLTTLAKDNGGVYPFDAVYQSIDGRREITGHGYSKMPIWGEYFMAHEMADPASNPRDAMAVTQGRILAVVYYLQSLQSE